MNECDKARKELENWQGFESLCGFMLNSNDGLPCDGEEKYREYVRHVQNCASCSAWVKDKIPAEEVSRMERLKKYCCPVMYGAVEHEDIDGQIKRTGTDQRNPSNLSRAKPVRKIKIIQIWPTFLLMNEKRSYFERYSEIADKRRWSDVNLSGKALKN